MKITNVTGESITVEFDLTSIFEMEALLRKFVGHCEDGAESLLLEALANTFQMADKACEGIQHSEMNRRRLREQEAS